MKKYLLAFALTVGHLVSNAQYNFYKISAGAGVGVTQYYGDLTKVKYEPAANVILDYNFTPFSSLGIEVQKGYISASDEWTRAFKNSFLSVNLNGKMTLGQVVDFEASNFLYKIRNLYLGTGVGIIKNNHTERVDSGPHIDGGSQQLVYSPFAGGKGGTAIYIPLNLGYRFDIQDRFGFNRYSVVLNYQFNTSLADNIDSYFNDPASHKNRYKDFYSLFTIGARISFGPEGLY